MRGVLREQYELLFGRAWSVWAAALLVGTLNVFVFAYDRPWTASDGARNWGDWLLVGLGVLERPDLIAPWLYSGSILNLGALAGALAAALLSREFAVRVAPPGELLKGGVGGLLMGMGAVLAFGCNLGGFFSATSALSLSGLAMMLGLGVGTYAGLRYVLWEVERWPGLSRGKTAALKDLAAKALDGTVPTIRELGRMGDDEIVERLTAVRGIGRWTVEMMLIFRLGRPDVMPATDYGVRKGYARAFRKRTLPEPRAILAHSERWRPFRTMASWYLWRANEMDGIP